LILDCKEPREFRSPSRPTNSGDVVGQSVPGVAAAVEAGVEAIDGTRLEMAADLALDVGDYTGDVTMVRLCRPESPV
jgi:hypothetical protein